MDEYIDMAIISDSSMGWPPFLKSAYSDGVEIDDLIIGRQGTVQQLSP